MTRRMNETTTQDEIKLMMVELKTLVKTQGDQLTDLQSLAKSQNDQLMSIQHAAVARAHLDDKIIAHESAMHDNGKTGLLTIRNEWISQKTQKNAIVVALIIQIILNIIK